MKLTIVTVVYNDLKRFKNTYLNICQQIKLLPSKERKKIEYVIKDGNSTDAIDEFMSNNIFNEINIKYYKSKDDGIYSAMNQAVQFADGEYVIFINAGDKLRTGGLKVIFKYLGESDILGFNYELNNTIKEQRRFDRLFFHRSPCHQGIVSKRYITKFSEDYKLASDYDFLLRNRRNIRWIDETVSIFGDEKKPIEYQKRINREKIKILHNSDVPVVNKYLSIIKIMLFNGIHSLNFINA